MNSRIKDEMNTFITIITLGEDINFQLNNIEKIAITTNTYGAKWDRELENLFSSFFSGNYQLLLDETYLYLCFDEQTFIQMNYLIYGENEDIYIDLKTIKLIESEIDARFIIPQYMGIYEGLKFFTNHMVGDAEPRNRVFTIGSIPNERKRTYIDSRYTLSDALNELHQEQEKDSDKKGRKWKISRFIEEKLHEEGLSHSELADKVGIECDALISNLKYHSITGDELLRIAIVLGIDLNELKDSYMTDENIDKVETSKQLLHISSLVKIGLTSGLMPIWELIIPQNQLYPLNNQERQLIAEQIEKGYMSGYMSGDVSRTWSLNLVEDNQPGTVTSKENNKSNDELKKLKEEAVNKCVSASN